jgi:uncharacterized membrane protein YkoI
MKTQLMIAAAVTSMALARFDATPAQAADSKEAKAEAKANRKREEREYKDMPKDVRKTIKKEVSGADDVDYFTAQQDGRSVYGARFTADDGKQIEVRVDDNGKLISRSEPAAAAVAGEPAAAQPAAAAAAQPDRPPEKVSAEQMPDAARATMQEETRGSKDVNFFRVWESGFVIYHATYTTPQGENLRLYVSEDGTVLRKRNEYNSPVETLSGKPAVEDNKLELSELPGPTQEAISKVTAGGSDIRYYKAMLGTRECYAAMFTGPDGKRRVTRVTDSGEVLQTKFLEEAKEPVDDKLTLETMPEPVRRTIERETKGASDVKYFRAKLGTKDVYNARFTTADGRDRSIRVDDAGKVVDSRETKPEQPKAEPEKLTLENMPKAVRATIERETKGASDVKFFRAKLGTRDVYNARFTTADGKDRSIRVDDSGKVVDSREN